MAITTLSSINTKNGQKKQPDPRSFTKMLEELKECQWYWGSISPSTATKLLKGYQPGTFLVRDSRSDNSIFSFSYSTNNGIYHTRINCFNGRFCLGGPRSLIGTESLPQFINDIIANCSPAVKDVSEFLSISEVGDENELNSRPLRVLMHPPLHTNPVSQQVDIRYPLRRDQFVPSLKGACRFSI
uniref:SH2 domain-containing protein n=1 Tax=Meloidogyne incognita TaxID=6306 RepID=A0A914NF04_MELIC